MSDNDSASPVAVKKRGRPASNKTEVCALSYIMNPIVDNN